MADFQKTFNPTEEDKEELVINLLTMIIELVKDKCCFTCKYSECRKEYMHSYETTEIYCKKKIRLLLTVAMHMRFVVC